jgi:light-harvesting protein B-800-850 alpha chain
MNQGKIWRVVKPTVGVPLFLSAVAVSSFAVHYVLYTNTTWIRAYHQGGQKPVKAAVVPAETTTAQLTIPIKE